ncbi:hypothetical protein [Citrobacter koseri]|uniref:hypothetical protein n=1 Tax=Citrobacter koseri TaxID=545 RepID=UPI0029439A0D|nr:hypothetical protein [Citrobacter koseri]MEB2702524.1 hypothetical protein [Citrobacter koseri]MEB2708330.1 hypothetical protein [Citrobacter koseri]MEB2770792.1 hypothetical protein [Citrobacter koseri]WOJ27896.1 hypothetical protein R1221_08700 [Citrobacter koseri]
MLNVTLLCSDIEHPVYVYLSTWQERNKDNYNIELVTSVADIKNANGVLFLISCSEFIKKEIRERFEYTLVLHASDLPQGRGWSPHVWDILTGKDRIVLSLLNAESGIDTGDIWRKIHIPLDGTELFDEINEKLFGAEIELINWFCQNYKTATPTSQTGNPDYYEKRMPENSELDTDKTIREQFNLLRVCDPNRFPAYFIINGQRYNITIKKVN